MALQILSAVCATGCCLQPVAFSCPLADEGSRAVTYDRGQDRKDAQAVKREIYDVDQPGADRTLHEPLVELLLHPRVKIIQERRAALLVMT